MFKQSIFMLSLQAFIAIIPSSPVMANATSLYPEPLTFGLFENGSQMVTADLNGDGMPDFAVVGNYADTNGTSVYLSMGQGKYAMPVFYPSSGTSSPYVIATGDLNGDGYPDIVIGNQGSYTGNQVSVLLNNGDGTFKIPVDYSPDANSEFITYSIAIGDATDDGKADVVVGSNQGAIYVVPGKGDGQLAVSRTQVLTPGTDDFDIDGVAVADLDGDGHPEVIAGVGAPGSVDVFRGLGGGVIAPTPTQSVPTGTNTIAIADVNNDGTPDVVAGRYGGNAVQVLLNNGGILTNSGVTYSLPLFTDLLWVRTADLDGDGKTDILVSNYSDRAEILYGNGDGTFEQPVRIPLGYPVQDIVAADTDGDGRLDLISLDNQNNLATLVAASNLGDRKFLSYHDYTYGTETGGLFPANDLASADFNGNGKPDIVTANSDSVSILLNTGNGGFSAPNVLTAGGGQAVAIGDVNDDGKPDLVTGPDFTTGEGNLVVYPGNGDGTFAPAIISTNTGSGGYGIALGDLDGDGQLDAATSESGGGKDQIRVCRGDGTGRFDCGAFPSVPVAYPNRVALADVNGDGNLDLMVTSGANQSGFSLAYIYLGDGNGGFGSSPSAILDVLGDGWSITIGDVNGDGKRDILIASDDEIASVFTGNGDGTFNDGAYYATGFMRGGSTGGAFAALADVNADGFPDIVTANIVDTSVSVLINQGDGTFSDPFQYAATSGAFAVLALDVNGDGLPDIVTAARSLGDDRVVSVYLHNPPSQNNQTPVAKNGTISTAEDKGATGRLVASDSDEDYILFSVTSLPSSGTLESLNYATGDFSYTPDNGYSGTDSFTFRATDSAGKVSNIATETISIKANSNGEGGGSSGSSSSGSGGGGLGILSLSLFISLLLGGLHCRLRNA